MNKTEFINELANRTGYTKETCIIINDVLESHFIFRKKNTPVIVADLMEKLSLEQSQADDLFKHAMAIIREQTLI